MVSCNFVQEEMCEEHEQVIQYFCINCFKSICSDCAVMTQEHKNHKLEKLSKLYSKCVGKIKEKLNDLE